MNHTTYFNLYYNLQRVKKTGEILPVFNIGETRQSFKERQKHGDWAKAIITLNAAGIEIVNKEWWEGFCLRHDKSKNHDSIIHKDIVLETGIWKTGSPDGSQRGEWFKFDPEIWTHEMIRHHITNKFFSGKPKEYKAFEPYAYQRDFLNKIASAWETYKDFLLAAKCRSGKSAMTLAHIVESKFKLTVCCSRYTSPKSSWRIDADTWFPTIQYISVENASWREELDFWMKEDDIQIVLWGSVQSLHSRVDNLPPVDLLILDEAHIGWEGKQFVSINKTLNTRVLYITATASNLAWQFPQLDHKFVYTIFDEKRDSDNGVFKTPRPELEVFCMGYDVPAWKPFLGDSPDSLRNRFLLSPGMTTYVDESSVNSFAMFLFDLQHKETRILEEPLLLGDHYIMALNGIANCNAFKLIAEKVIPTLVVCGKAKENQETINKFISEHTRSLILTDSANILGATYEDVHTVINCKTGESESVWTQLAMRGGSGKKEKWRVIDFDIHRVVNCTHRLYQTACDHNSLNREVHPTKSVNIFNFKQSLIKVDMNIFQDILAGDIQTTRTSMSGIVKLLDMDKCDLDLSVGVFGTTTPLQEVLCEEHLDEDKGANNKSSLVREGDINKKEEDPNKRKVQIITAILDSLPLCMYYMLKHGETIVSIDDLLGSKLYPSLSGDLNGLLAKCINSNPKSRKAITSRISTEANIILRNIRTQDATETISALSCSSGISQAIPLIVFNPMIDKLQDTSQTLIHCDPAGLHTARLLERNVNVYGLTVWDDCANHTNRVECVDKNVTVTNEQPVLRPTAILANPPYQDTSNKAKNNKLWPPFLLQYLDLLVDGGDMSIVCPASFIGTTGFGKKFLKLCSTIYNLKEIDYTADQHFTQGIKICSWHLTKEPYQGKTRVITDDGEFDWDLRDGVPVWGDKALKTSILNKIANSNHPRIPLKMGQAIAKEDYCDDGEYEVLHSGNNPWKTNVKPETGDVLKFVVPYSTSYKKRFITNAHIGMFNAWCPIVDEEEGERLSKIFEHPLIQLYIDNYKKTGGFAPAVKNGEVPDITDYDKLDTQFNFTEEEVAYLVTNNVL